MTRQLSSIRKIKDLSDVQNTDNLQVASVDGWKVVVKKGEFSIGDEVVFVEADAFVPTALAPFLHQVNFKGVTGGVVKNLKIRGQISQGLILPLSALAQEDENLDIILGISKYELPVKNSNSLTPLPDILARFELKRIQNLSEQWENLWKYQDWLVTEKLEGSYMSIGYLQNELIVASKNCNVTQDLRGFHMRAVTELNLVSRIQKLRKNCFLQGELIGPKIQKNIYNLESFEFRIFDVFDSETGEYSPENSLDISDQLGIPHVPVLKPYSHKDPIAADELLELATGKSEIGSKPEREGLVFRNRSTGFKVISPSYSLKNI